MRRFIFGRLKKRNGQATTEVVLLFPVFMIIALMFAKIFALLVLVQKMEIASYYAARKWQLESHRNVSYIKTFDDSVLRDSIVKNVKKYLGFDTPAEKFLGLRGVDITVERTQVWNIVTLTVETRPVVGKELQKLLCAYPSEIVCAQPYGRDCQVGYDFVCNKGTTLDVVRYVPNRDRPIKYDLPGLSN